MIPVVEQLKALIPEQPVNPLRPNQIAEFTEEMTRQEQMANAPAYVTGHSRGKARQRAQELGRLLAAQAPKLITGPRADAVRKKVEEVLDTVIKPGMLPRNHMRRNPPGAVGHVLRTEFHPVFKDAQLTVKRAMWGIDPAGAGDPDWTNMERFRRETTGEIGTSTFMADAQIPGVFAMSNLAKQNWPLAPPDTTALEQVRQREATGGAESPPATPPKARTPAQQAATKRWRDARAANIAARRATKPATG